MARLSSNRTVCSELKRNKMGATIKQFIILTISSTVLSCVLMYSLSVSSVSYAFSVSRDVANKVYNQINELKTKEFSRLSKCEVIHIGIVCTNYQHRAYLHTMLKSLYFYRSNPIHFHIMVDELSRKVLKLLFETWTVPQVSVTFYDINHFIADTKWVSTTKHYSEKFSLLKLMFPKAISISITSKIIVINTNLIFNDDIYELWNLFSYFDKHQAIGLVEHQNEYYLGKLHNKYPCWAIGKGFNSGVILYHLEHLISVNWNDLWKKTTEETLASSELEYPDQDVINTVLYKSPSLLFNIPCQWNIQINSYSESYKCYNSNKIKLVNWNWQEESNVTMDEEYFGRLYTTFVEHNGHLFQYQRNNCSLFVKREVNNANDACNEYNRELGLKRRILLFIREFKHEPRENDITYVSQLSRGKMKLVEELSKRWQGPMSLTLYVTDSEFYECLNFIENSPVLQKRYNIAYHAVFKDGEYYPINELRNVALDNVVTPYVFLVDLDLFPMKSLYWILQNSIRSVKSMNKLALVVPAFETQTVIPQNKIELLKLLDRRKVYQFHIFNAPQGHNQTNYLKWKKAKAPYYVNWKPFYEPYIVVKKDVVRYDPVFIGFGWNKVSHIMELVGQEYKFLILANAFIVHKNHLSTTDKDKFLFSDFHQCVKNKMTMFIDRINNAYGTKFDKKAVT